MAIATGQQALAADVNAIRQIATGSYTGNGVASRQITIGFLSKLVLIGQGSKQATLIPAYTQAHDQTAAKHYEDTVNCYIHGSDGFVISTAGINMNVNTGTYYYFAIKG